LKDKVECPICGKKYVRLMTHVTATHGISKEKLLKEYPETKLTADSTGGNADQDDVESMEEENQEEIGGVRKMVYKVRNMLNQEIPVDVVINGKKVRKFLNPKKSIKSDKITKNMKKLESRRQIRVERLK